MRSCSCERGQKAEYREGQRKGCPSLSQFSKSTITFAHDCQAAASSLLTASQPWTLPGYGSGTGHTGRGVGGVASQLWLWRAERQNEFKAPQREWRIQRISAIHKGRAFTVEAAAPGGRRTRSSPHAGSSKSATFSNSKTSSGSCTLAATSPPNVPPTGPSRDGAAPDQSPGPNTAVPATPEGDSARSDIEEPGTGTPTQ